MRTDFNVPLDDSGAIADDFRIRAALPTIEWLTERGATVVTASHLGRPKGAPDPKYAMDPVRARLAELAPGVELLENLRFDPGETGNDDAFVAAARSTASTATSTTRSVRRTARTRRSSGRPSTCPSAMGRLLEKEVEVLLGLRNKPKRPFVAVLGGAKISDKLGVVEALLEVVDSLVIGGAMCFTFFAAQGKPIGDSLFEPDQVETCGDCSPGGEGQDHPSARRHHGVDADGEFATFGSQRAGRWQGLRHRSRLGSGVHRRHHGRSYGVLERPDGHVRRRPFRGGHPHRGAGDGRHQGVHGRRRRRFGRSARPVQASTTRSITCRPGEGPASNCSRTATSPAWPQAPSTAHPGTHERTPMTRKPLISGNWKMNLNHFEAIQTVQKLHYLLPKDVFEQVDVSVHPPFTDIRSVQTRDREPRSRPHARRPALPLGGQGAFTGEVSPAFLAKLERRARGRRPQRAARDLRRDRRDGQQEGRRDPAARHDADRVLWRDARRARGGRDRDQGARPDRGGLAGRSDEQIASLVIAYEPIWAIGTGKTATADDAQAVCQAIRERIARSPTMPTRRRGPHPVRRIGEGSQCRRPDGAARH